MTPPIPLSCPESSSKAFKESMNDLLPDMPLLMHGSGDVPPADVNPDTAALVSELTAQYISKLVDAAVDAHDLLTDGAGGILPPPALPDKRKPSLPPRPVAPTKASSGSASLSNRKRHREKEDFWDDPLPEPKVRSATSTTTTLASAKEEDVDGGDASTEKVDPDVWVGVAGVDFWENRSRRAHVGSTSAIGTQCFIFPICHDALLYTRVMELQAARRTIAPVLMDPCWMEMINEEGDHLEKSTRQRSGSVSKNAKEEDDEDQEGGDANDESEVLPSWPGMDSLLPIHRTED